MKRRFIAGLLLSLASTQVAQAAYPQKMSGKDARKTVGSNDLAKTQRAIATRDQARGT